MAQTMSATENASARLMMTLNEFQSWQSDDIRAEWVDGEVLVLLPPTVRHAQIIGFLHILMANVALSRGIGEVLIAAFQMRLTTIPSAREPDIAFVATAHLGRIQHGRLDGPADLVVEVLSPDSVTRDRREKLREFAVAGIAEYLIVDGRDGRSEMRLYRLHEEGYYDLVSPDGQGRLWSQVMPGLWFDPSWLVGESLPNPFTVGARMLTDGAEAGN